MTKVISLFLASLLIASSAIAGSHGGAMKEEDKKKMEECKKADPAKMDAKMKADCEKLKAMK